MNMELKNRQFYTLVFIWTMVLILLIYFNAQALDTVSKGKSEIETISGEGSASILQSVDIDEAKGKALENAKNEAILKSVGLYVNPEILSKKKGTF